MSGGVSKIFGVLVVAVACVLIGAFVLNVMVPNATTTLVDATEDMIFRATGLSFDFNNNGRSGGGDSIEYRGSEKGNLKGDVEGFN